MCLSALLVLLHLILTIEEETEVYGGCLTYPMSQCVLRGRALFESRLLIDILSSSQAHLLLLHTSGVARFLCRAGEALL